MEEFGGGQFLQTLLTNLVSRVGSLEGTTRTFMENWTTQDKLANDARRLLYERIELLSRQLDRIANDLHGVQQDVAELKKEIDEDVSPVIKTWEVQTAQKLGAKGVWAVVTAGFITIVSALAYVADKLFTYLTTKS